MRTAIIIAAAYSLLIWAALFGLFGPWWFWFAVALMAAKTAVFLAILTARESAYRELERE